MRNSLLSHNFNRFLIIQLCSAATDGCQAGRHVCVCVRVCIMQLMQLIFCAAALFCLICNRFVEVSSQSDCVLCKHQNVIKTNRSGFLISFSFLVSPAWLLLCRLFFFAKSGKAPHVGWVFIFIMCAFTIWCTAYAFMRLVAEFLLSATRAPPPCTTTSKAYRKWKFMTLCLASASGAAGKCRWLHLRLWWLSLFLSDRAKAELTETVLNDDRE